MEPPDDAIIDAARMNVVQAIRFATKEVAVQQVSPEVRALLLAWIFHNVGDIHQPLHSTALFSTQLSPEGDRGGNSVRTRQAGNLHALWDNFPGRSDSYRDASNKALMFVADADHSTLGKEAAALLDARAWAHESLALAKSAAYDDEVLGALRRMESASGGVEQIELSEAYLRSGGHLAETRLIQARYRLGAVSKLCS